MAQLGECAVFFFKYQPEMLRLFLGKQTTVEPAGDDDVKKMARAVGNQCCQEIGEFLTECGKIIEHHFQEIGGRCEQRKLASSTEEWSVSYGVAPKGKNKPWKMEFGVDIPTEKAEIIPWIWGEGGTAAENKLKDRLGEALPPSAGEIELGKGAVALATIPIPAEEANGFALDRDGLLDHVKQAISAVKLQMLELMYADVMRL